MTIPHYGPKPRGWYRFEFLTRTVGNRLFFRPLLAAISVFSFWNWSGYHLAGWISSLYQGGWQPDGLRGNRDVLLCAVITIIVTILTLYVIRKAWQGVGWLGRILTLGLIVAVNLLLLAYLDNGWFHRTPAGLATLAQLSLFGVFVFGLSRAEIDRRISGVTNVTAVDHHHQHQT